MEALGSKKVRADIEPEVLSASVNYSKYSDAGTSAHASKWSSANFDEVGIRLHKFFWLLVADLSCLFVASLAAWFSSELLRDFLVAGPTPSTFPDSNYLKFLMIVSPVVMIVGMCYAEGHYTRYKSLWAETREFYKISAYTIAFVTIVLFIANVHISRLWFFSYWAMVLVFVPAVRFLVKKQLIRRGKWFRSVVVFGAGVNALKCAQSLDSDEMMGLKIVAFVAMPRNGSFEYETEVSEADVISLDVFSQTIGKATSKPHFLFAPDSTAEFEENKLFFNQLSSVSNTITISPPFYGLPLDGAEIINVPKSDSVLIRLQNNLAKKHSRWMKRLFDIFVSGCVLLLLSPLIAVMALLVKLDGGPIFFKQARVGRYGVPFGCWKLRSMAPDANKRLSEYLSQNSEAREEWLTTQKLKDDPRVTKIGRWLRASSIDELPQLWNVFVGEMSLVGPRPIVLDEKDRYGSLLSYYLNQKPGITGLWQISGRNNTTYTERVELDVWYSRNWSFWLDLVILARTIPAVFCRSGAY